EIGQSLRLRRVLVEQLAYSLALPLLFLILAVAVIIFYQVRAAMRPMQRLSQQLDQRAAGDFERLRGHRMPAEIAPLFEAFNRLIERMQTAIVREREFADNAAHELRTPLAVLKARAQIVVRDLAGDPARQEPARQLAAATDRATGVIDQLLFLGRLAASDAPRQAIDLSQLVADVARELAPAAIAKAQNFEVAIAPAITVAGQPEALMMVVRNLIDNAVRYTPRGGNIEVTLAGAGPDTAELAVCDNGPGIPETHHLSILDRFARLPSQESGSGLGLSIVQQIVERHAGHLALANRDPCGLAATVTLPMLPAAG
ncbi:MAG: ATP-binding protein, partial [Polymorphobacter sp.]